MSEIYTDRTYGVHWTLAFGLPFLILVCIVTLIFGCTYTRNAPLLNVEANGNTVPVYAAP